MTHTGGGGLPGYVHEVLDLLHVRRINHGVRTKEGEALITCLIKEQVPLTICPLSDLKLKVSPEMAKHSLRRILQRGVLITINSDDPACSSSYINRSFEAFTEVLGLNAEGIKILCANSFRTSSLDEAGKEEWIWEIEGLHAESWQEAV